MDTEWKSFLENMQNQMGRIETKVDHNTDSLNSIDEPLNRVESKVDTIQSQLNTVEHRVIFMRKKELQQ